MLHARAPVRRTPPFPALSRTLSRALWRCAGHLPSQCAVCRGWGRGGLCTECRARHAAPRSRCLRCAVGVPEGVAACAACLREPPPYQRASAAVDYDFPWSRLIGAFKFRAALDLASPLATLLAEAASGQGACTADLVVPVPLSPERLRERGMNQAWELARRVGPLLDLEARSNALLRLVDTAHLAALPRAERAARIRGAFAVASAAELRGRHVALVDDVMTSGATVAEASRTLLAAGAASVQVWVVARTPSPDAR